MDIAAMVIHFLEWFNLSFDFLKSEYIETELRQKQTPKSGWLND